MGNLEFNVSISDEMPGPWRLEISDKSHRTFYLVSISDEMPGPWRLKNIYTYL
jgi:hypothetical protein